MIKHYPKCSADYPEKTGQPQSTTDVDLEDGDIARTCDDCGAFELLPKATTGMDGQRLRTFAAVKQFLLAGNATLTIVGKDSRFTYNIKKADDDKKPPADRYTHSKDRTVYFVSLLSGADNNNDYRYLGIIELDARAFEPFTFRRTRNSKIGAEAPSHIAFAWLFDKLKRGYLPESVEVWHEGRCGRCNRKLTVPESIEAGIGPECAGRMEGAA